MMRKNELLKQAPEKIVEWVREMVPVIQPEIDIYRNSEVFAKSQRNWHIKRIIARYAEARGIVILSSREINSVLSFARIHGGLEV